MNPTWNRSIFLVPDDSSVCKADAYYILCFEHESVSLLLLSLIPSCFSFILFELLDFQMHPLENFYNAKKAPPTHFSPPSIYLSSFLQLSSNSIISCPSSFSDFWYHDIFLSSSYHKPNDDTLFGIEVSKIGYRVRKVPFRLLIEIS